MSQDIKCHNVQGMMKQMHRSHSMARRGPGRRPGHVATRKMKHIGQKTQWATAKAWDLPLKMTDIVTACQQCSVCVNQHPRPLAATTGC